MTPLPIPPRSYAGPYKINGSPKIVNAYAEAGGEDNKSLISLLPVAGMKTFGAENGNKCRGLMYLDDERLLYSVQGQQILKIEENETVTSLGLIAGEKPVFIARNDAADPDIVIVSEGRPYLVKDGALSLNYYEETLIDDDDVETNVKLEFLGVTYVGGYFIFWREDGRFYVSDLQSTVVRDIQFATAEADPDGLTVCHGTGNLLYLFGHNTTELWSTTGADFPLSKIGGSYLRFGTNSPHTVKDFNNGVAIVAGDNQVYQINGSSYKSISSPEVTRLIEQEEDISALVAFTHERGQNKFYCLQGSSWTKEYNAATGFWHDREDVNGNPWHGIFYAKAWNKDIYGDKILGQLFEGDYSIFTDNGKELSWGFDTSIIHDSPNGMAFNSIELDMETGDGQNLQVKGEVMVRWSDDNGRTYKGERRLSLGKTGDYSKRLRTQMLGQCGVKGRIFSIRVTDPVIRAITGFYGDVSKVLL